MSFVLYALGFCTIYILLLFLFAFFFQGKRPQLTNKTVKNLAILVLMNAASDTIVALIADPNWKNRLLHGLGGGFIAMIVCFLVATELGLRLGRWRFLIFSFLVVTTLGVGNELIELALQESTGIIFAPTSTDTWLDLLSNTVGIVVASCCLASFLDAKSGTKNTGDKI